MTTISLFPGLPEPPEWWVYYATDGHDIKIGRTCDFSRRGGELKLIYLLKFRGGGFEERRHQKMWAAYRISGTEWFRPADELLLWITMLLEARSPELAVLQSIIKAANARRRDAA
jgi:hypothetical protein